MNKMKITKSQLRKIIKEAVWQDKETERTLKQVGREKRAEAGMPPHSRYNDFPGKSTTLDFLKTELGTWQPSALEHLKQVLTNKEKKIRFDLTQEVLDIIAGWSRLK